MTPLLMKTIKALFTVIIPILLIPFIFTACNDELDTNPQSIGSNILPESDFYGKYYIDTFHISTNTSYNNPLLTVGADTLLAGSINDSKFGSLKASFISQFYPDTTSVSPSGKILTSYKYPVKNVSLILYVSNIFGTSPALPLLNVYELNTSIDSSMGYSNINPATYKGALLNKSFSEVNINGSYIEIPLTDNFAQRFANYYSTSVQVNDSTTAQGYNFSTNNFLNDFKGIMVNAQDDVSANSLVKVIPWRSYISVTLEKADTISQDSVQIQEAAYNFRLDYPINNYHSYRVNYFEHNFSNTELSNAVASTLSGNAYIKGLAGASTSLEITNLTQIIEAINEKVVVKSALLYLPVDNTANEIYQKPQKVDIRFSNGDYLPGDPLLTGESSNLLVREMGDYYPEYNAYVLNLVEYFNEQLNGAALPASFEIFVSDISEIMVNLDLSSTSLVDTVLVSQYNAGGVKLLNTAEKKPELKVHLSAID